MRMNINVYLPDDLGAMAKAAELNLSRLLRDAVSSELDRKAALKETLNQKGIYEVRVEDRDGKVYMGRISGRHVASSGDKDVYLTADERVIVYDRFRLKYLEVDDPIKELRSNLEPGAYMDAMRALGHKPVVDL